MKRHLHLLITTLLLTASAVCFAQSETNTKSPSKAMAKNSVAQAIIERSRQGWEAYKKHDVAGMKAVTGNDYGSYSPAGYSNLKEDIAGIDKLNIESYSIDDPTVTMATKDVAILRYKCNLKGSQQGKKFKPSYVTEVWVDRSGKWMIVSYQETII